jgi:two-component system, response regulator YesN
MYKLILVDDEEYVREGIVQEVDWEQVGFEVVDRAENGREAIELIERLLPDVVVTDIMMPFMDGMQLAEWIKERYPAIKIIILTGFDEFEYAQKAIRLHIDEYVLKPFSAQEFIDVLLKVNLKIDEEISQKENVQLLQEHYHKSLPILRETFLASLISRKLSKAEIEEKLINYNVKLTGDRFVVSVLSIDNNSETKERLQSLKYSGDQELKLFAVYNIAEEIVNKHQSGPIFMFNDRVVLLAVTEGTARNTMMEQLLRGLDEIVQSIEKYLKFSVTIGVGTVRNHKTEIKYSYEDAVLALDYRQILGNNRVICIDDVEKRIVENVRFDELQAQAIIRCIKTGTTSEMQEIVEDLFKGFVETQVSIQDYQIYLLEILTSILKAAKDANLDLDTVFGTNFSIIAEVYKFNQLHEAKDWIINLCMKIMQSVVNERKYSYQNLIDQAKEYTQEHYQESDISINKVCSHLHISTGYFSSIFKKEVKMTFVNYLIQIRMESAKELLRSTELKSFEIAEKVGYADPNYFSFCFRKLFGLSPKEYRNGSREGKS